MKVTIMNINTIKDFEKVDWSKQIQGDVVIASNLGFLQPDKIWCSGSLIIEAAGTSIEAGTSIKAGWSIKAGGSIKAGTSIKAGGYGITSGCDIICKTTLSAKLRIISGVSPYHDGLNNTIKCGKLLSGTVIGNFVETGLPNETPKQCHGGQTGKFCSECGEKL